MCTPRRRCGSRPGSVARALGVQRREIWQAITGSLSTSPSLAGQLNPHNLGFFPLALLLYHVCITPSHKLSSSLLCASHGTTAVAHQALPFVTATDGASLCTCACHVSCPPEKKERTHNILRGDAAQGAGRYKPALRRDFKINRAATVTATAAVQQHQRLQLWSL